ncbi:hypothetical protein [Bartonella sp. A05]|uniref:hypothetical protein n=1 Tax=Bartonella sp. A05 TaxID=2967261 RepID=UPI0022A8FF7A|nr:hypothetical protein [Bartonella sp. A05]MCZ2203694.1 hypothetical protein [Bartonella sp. A05]
MSIRYFVVMFTAMVSLFFTGQAYSHTVIHKPTPVMATLYQAASHVNGQPTCKMYRLGDGMVCAIGNSNTDSSNYFNKLQKWWNLAKNIYAKGESVLSAIGKIMHVIINLVDKEFIKN